MQNFKILLSIALLKTYELDIKFDFVSNVEGGSKTFRLQRWNPITCKILRFYFQLHSLRVMDEAKYLRWKLEVKFFVHKDEIYSLYTSTLNHLQNLKILLIVALLKSYEWDWKFDSVSNVESRSETFYYNLLIFFMQHLKI